MMIINLLPRLRFGYIIAFEEKHAGWKFDSNHAAMVENLVCALRRRGQRIFNNMTECLFPGSMKQKDKDTDSSIIHDNDHDISNNSSSTEADDEDSNSDERSHTTRESDESPAPHDEYLSSSTSGGLTRLESSSSSTDSRSHKRTRDDALNEYEDMGLEDNLNEVMICHIQQGQKMIRTETAYVFLLVNQGKQVYL